MTQPSWTDILSALSTAFTLCAVIVACIAWSTAKKTLRATELMAEQGEQTLLQMRADSEAMRADSALATRPYLSAVIVPSLAGERVWDLIIENFGRSAAYNFTMGIQGIDVVEGKVTDMIRELASSQMMIPPGARVRSFWYAMPDERSDPAEGVGFRDAHVKLYYSDIDGNRFDEDPEVRLRPHEISPAPMPWTGSEAASGGADQHERNRNHALRAIAHHLGEIHR